MRQFRFGVDFDGTCVTHEYPKIGMEAIGWFVKHDIPLLDANNYKLQNDWTTSRKIHCHRYIDDAALGTPLIFPEPDENGKRKRPYVDWAKIYNLLIKEGFLTTDENSTMA